MTTEERHRRKFHHVYEPVRRKNGSRACAKCVRLLSKKRWAESEEYREMHRKAAREHASRKRKGGGR